MKILLRIFLALGVAGLGGGCIVARAIPMLPTIVTELRVNPPTLLSAYDFIEKRDFEMADHQLRRLEKGKQTPLLTSELAYVRALLAEKQGRTDEAIAKYRGVIANFPNTPDAYLAARKVARLGAAK